MTNSKKLQQRKETLESPTLKGNYKNVAMMSEIKQNSGKDWNARDPEKRVTGQLRKISPNTTPWNARNERYTFFLRGDIFNECLMTFKWHATCYADVTEKNAQTRDTNDQSISQSAQAFVHYQQNSTSLTPRHMPPCRSIRLWLLKITMWKRADENLCSRSPLTDDRNDRPVAFTVIAFIV